MNPHRIAFLAWMFLFTALSVSAMENDCARLTPEQRKQTDEILDNQYCYDCCDRTITECLDETPHCLWPGGWRTLSAVLF
ncbi:hypothetical protein ACFL4G_11315, partial [Thermodesulfobacteriota bacterium]